ncbi:MAG: late competence development ComFB family protein [Spirochaetaceae bacterium]|jgi:competence protein ComFB|nr:late competence development ComFB family protein [Spirochaetaceae bacterium]
MYTEIHNTIEDIVYAQVTEICNAIESNKQDELCTCRQCRVDTVCYVLNRIEPHYISSNRGIARAWRRTLARQQKEAEIVSLIYKGIKQVNHNRRPFTDHGSGGRNISGTVSSIPVFSIPAIIGCVFNGRNFAPLAEASVELLRNGELVVMKDAAWRNPFLVMPNIEGTFTFWPASIPAASININKVFEFSVKVEASGLESLTHFFTIPVISELQTADVYSMERSFKLPNLYLFPEGDRDDDF